MFTSFCAACNKPIGLSDEAAGKSIRCLNCQAIILVPMQLPTDTEDSSGAQTKDYTHVKTDPGKD
jgi:hypothetical protein